MVMVQVSLTEEENKMVEIYKALNDCQNKREAIKKIIAENHKKRR
jgi:hypothetical protein